MAGRFCWKKFSEIDLSDPFFDSLKEDYSEFPIWFKTKSDNNSQALVFYDDLGIGAFVYLKNEDEEIELANEILPKKKRIKIGTLRLAERIRGVRLGEGALGVALWIWQSKQYDEIYVTVFDKQKLLIHLFERFGFNLTGKNPRGECVYIKSRCRLDFSDPYKSFPFVCPKISKAGIIPIKQSFHDALFPYSELKGSKAEIEEETAGNGITKIYIACPSTSINYQKNEPVFIYRIYEGAYNKTFRSVITSYCTITKVINIKENGVSYISLGKFINIAGNKTIFDCNQLTAIYNRRPNVFMIEMVYNGFMGKGHNITHKALNERGLFSTYPYNIEYSKEQFMEILELGDINVQNVIVD